MVIKNRLKELLSERNLNNTILSELTGTDRTNLSKYINGTAKMYNEETLNAICRVLNCQISDFLIYQADETDKVLGSENSDLPKRRGRNKSKQVS